VRVRVESLVGVVFVFLSPPKTDSPSTTHTTNTKTNQSYQRTCAVAAGRCVGAASGGRRRAPTHLVIGNAGAVLSLNVGPDSRGEGEGLWQVCGRPPQQQRSGDSHPAGGGGGVLFSHTHQKQPYLPSSSSSSCGSLVRRPHTQTHTLEPTDPSPPPPPKIKQTQPQKKAIKLWWGYLRCEADAARLACEMVSDSDGGVMDAFELRR
jgi:hypothetical protein